MPLNTHQRRLLGGWDQPGWKCPCRDFPQAKPRAIIDVE
jgi:hypothetical protein